MRFGDVLAPAFSVKAVTDMSEHGNRPEGWQLERSGPEAYERYLVPRMFAPWADRLVEHGAVRAGDRVLDVACGTGIVARRAAPVVGEDGAVVGLDLNETMLAVARATGSEVEPPIEWRRGDAADLPFGDGTFDVVLCQQALQFVSEPEVVLREMKRVLVPDGRLATNVWRPLEFHRTYELMADALERYVGEEAAAMMRSPFAVWDRSELRALVVGAGFREVVVTVEIGSMRYPSVEEFLRREAASSPLSESLGALPPDVRDALVEDLEESLEGYTDDRGVVFPMESYVVTARA